MADRNALKALQVRRRQALAALEACHAEMMRCHEQLRRLDEEEADYLNQGKPVAENSSAPRPVTEKIQETIKGSAYSIGRLPQDDQRLREDGVINRKSPNKGKGMPRPDGVPSIAEMVEIILLEARKKKKLGVTGPEILQIINDRWWPGVSEASVIPKMYRIQRKQQKFIRIGDRWDLG